MYKHTYETICICILACMALPACSTPVAETNLFPVRITLCSFPTKGRRRKDLPV